MIHSYTVDILLILLLCIKLFSGSVLKSHFWIIFDKPIKQAWYERQKVLTLSSICIVTLFVYVHLHDMALVKVSCRDLLWTFGKLITENYKCEGIPLWWLSHCPDTLKEKTILPLWLITIDLEEDIISDENAKTLTDRSSVMDGYRLSSGQLPEVFCLSKRDRIKYKVADKLNISVNTNLRIK